MRTEREFIRKWEHFAHRKCAEVLVGIGDDAALVAPKPGLAWVIASDLMVEDVHFRRRYFPAHALGHKALAVNLSDLAAMGAVPRFCLLNLALPKDCEESFADGIMQGLIALADHYHVVLLGGDTSSSPERLYLDVTVIGEIQPNQAVLRSKAHLGDLIFVSGDLGNAAAGLHFLENQSSTAQLQTNTDAIRAAIRSHLAPSPQLALGQLLARKHLATAMMDVSDGLSIDLSRLCEASGVGALLLADEIPVAAGARIASHRSRQDPLELALHGGEDYELLFTVNPAHRSEVEQLATDLSASGHQTVLTCIGHLTEKQTGLQIETWKGVMPLQVRGFDHFATKDS